MDGRGSSVVNYLPLLLGPATPKLLSCAEAHTFSLVPTHCHDLWDNRLPGLLKLYPLRTCHWTGPRYSFRGDDIGRLVAATMTVAMSKGRGRMSEVSMRHVIIDLRCLLCARPETDMVMID